MTFDDPVSGSSSQRPIAVTMGEPAGIGGEITCLAWARHSRELPPFVLIDDPDRIANLAATVGHPINVKAVSNAKEAVAVWPNALPVIPVSLNAPAEPGRINPENAPAVIASLDRAIALATNGEVAGLVTNPIQKSALYAAGFDAPGHTEYLAKATQASGAPVMMLAGPELRVVPVTIHSSLADAARDLRTEDIVHCALVAAEALRRDFAITQPRLAIAALNPHAGEDGALGTEEATVIAPAVVAIRAAGIEVSGPAAADTMFHPEARQTYDAAICMYHDQALIPLKMLDFHRSVNITLGLPIVRTSPDHGTALGIAGAGRANPTSFIEAVKLASLLAARRQASATPA
ncbi:MAG: 4-hydroxythreonine-4-phosphate dehydrogenase PdxA [Alphaproteobacteria bacterium]|nr:4-hydroxythreonine-4-phosphate dehydrogenase PdxA [Alphaproteobacteria bacterium]